MAMKTNLKTIPRGFALCAALFIGTAANAHDWHNHSGRYGNGGGYGFQGDHRNGEYRDGYLVNATCSGDQGFRIQNRLSREVQNGNLDRRTSRRIQRDIDRLRFREEHECREGDFRAARNIGREYIRIRQWIDQESGRYNSGWHHR